MRLYNGCPDSDLKALYDAIDKATELLEKSIPGARCVYFPCPGFFQVWLECKPLSDECSSRFKAIQEALERKSNGN